MDARWDLPKLELAVSTAKSVKEHCHLDGDIEEAHGLWNELSLGYHADMVLPIVGTIVGTNFIGKALGRDFAGLMWSKTLFRTAGKRALVELGG